MRLLISTTASIRLYHWTDSVQRFILVPSYYLHLSQTTAYLFLLRLAFIFLDLLFLADPSFIQLNSFEIYEHTQDGVLPVLNVSRAREEAVPLKSIVFQQN